MKSEEGKPVAAASVSVPYSIASESLSILFREHHRRILLAAYRITGSMADAEDVLQSVFMRLVDAGDANVKNAGSYLYRAAINGALDLLRRRKVAAAEPLEAAQELQSVGRSPEAGTSDRELGARLRKAIGELTPRAAEMFTLRYVEELTNGEIAALMGTSQAVIAVTLYQSRGKLKKRLTELERGIQ
jgi:RNA polymerase sigma-70 factor (ECF subfamily)